MLSARCRRTTETKNKELCYKNTSTAKCQVNASFESTPFAYRCGRYAPLVQLVNEINVDDIDFATCHVDTVTANYRQSKNYASKEPEP